VALAAKVLILQGLSCKVLRTNGFQIRKVEPSVCRAEIPTSVVTLFVKLPVKKVVVGHELRLLLAVG
jgi:hypothetical protein